MQETNIKVFTTKDYDSFKKLLGNRDVSEERVVAIVNSIKAVGYMPAPILANTELEIIDGQGRLEACKRLNLPVYVIIKEGIGIEECITMNIKMKNWVIDDYVKSYADRGFETYQKLVDLKSEYPYFGYLDLAKIMSGVQDNGGVRKRLVKGIYQISDYSLGCKCIEFIDAMHEKIERIACKKSIFYSVLQGLFYNDLIDVDRMIEQFNKYECAMYVGDVDSCLNYLQDVYNYRKHSTFRFKDNYLTKMETKRMMAQESEV